MNSVQRNFKRQQKQIEWENKNRWNTEKYKDRYTGKKYLRYYDEHGTLLKTQEIKTPFRGLLKVLLWIIGICVVLAVIAFVYVKFHVIIF